MCLSVFVCVYMCTMSVYLMPLEAREGVGFPEIGITGGCELLCGCWEQNKVPLREQQVLLNHLAISPAILSVF